MDAITFSLGCRNCHQTDSTRWQYDYNDPEGGLPLAGRPEIGIVRMIELMNRDLGVVCPFCQSPHLEVLEPNVNGHILFDYDQLCQQLAGRDFTVFSLTVNRVGTQGQLDTHMLTNPTQVTPGFLLMVLDALTELLDERPDHDFSTELNGQAYFCVVGRWHADPQQRSVYPQRYGCRGLTREELCFVIQSTKEDTASW